MGFSPVTFIASAGFAYGFISSLAAPTVHMMNVPSHRSGCGRSTPSNTGSAARYHAGAFVTPRDVA